jgi:hypothetical protein
MAHTLATANSTNRPPDDAAPVVNTDAVLHFGPPRDILTDNRQQLIAQNILNAGLVLTLQALSDSSNRALRRSGF